MESSPEVFTINNKNERIDQLRLLRVMCANDWK